jgi:hypothetical protein
MSKRRGLFNIPIFGTIIDVLFIVIAIPLIAYIWYNHHPLAWWGDQKTGIEIMREADANIVTARLEAQAEVDNERSLIEEKRTEIAYAESNRDSLDRLVKRMERNIPVEINRISASQDKSQQLTADFLRLRGRLGTEQDKLREARLDLENLTVTANDLSQRLAARQDTVFMEDQARLALVDSVEAARAYRERDPWSMFPVSASLSAYTELSDEADFVSFSLSKDFYRKGKFDFGITGALGFGDEQGTSIREIGVYANYELWFRRASIDLGVGYSSLRLNSADDDNEPYVSVMLRYAPYYRERAFLLLGTKYSHETLSYLVGVAFGRR